MPVVSIIFIYLVVWWTVLFAILPIGVTSHWEAGRPVPGGGDPSSPIEPKLKRKFITTTWVSAIVTAIILAVLHFHLIPLPQMPGSG